MEVDMIATQAASDAPSVSITHGSASAPPGEEQAQVMDVDQLQLVPSPLMRTTCKLVALMQE